MIRYPMKSLASALILAACALVAHGASPMAPALSRFSEESIPKVAPTERPVQRSWAAPTSAPAGLPGRGLAEHPMLFAGEGYNVLHLVNEGRVVWTYQSGPGGEIDDVWLLTNGNVLYTKQTFVEELSPAKQVLWHYDAPQGTEIHSAQPLGLDKVLIVQNGRPAKAIIFHVPSGRIEYEHDIPVAATTSVHGQFRRIRQTAAGTFLLPYLSEGKVVEYDREFRQLWSYPIPFPWAAARLANGNTLIVAEHDGLVREVNSAGQTVWEISRTELPPELHAGNFQTAERLANGNTVLFTSVGGTKPDQRPTMTQCIEVTPAKQVVWVLQDWKNLGPSTTAQFLDQPGVPEAPGALQK